MAFPRQIMRALPRVMVMLLLCSSALLPGQSLEENWKQCKSDDPDRSIAGCSALIQSGQETGINLARAFNYRGAAGVRKGEYDQAIQDFDQALKLNPNSAEAFYNRGRTYARKGDDSHAILDYDQALRLNPSLANAFYGRGIANTNKGDYDHAVQDYDQA